MSLRLILVISAAVAALCAPAIASAHIGGAASIIVPLDHVDPGASFPIIGADLGSDASVSITLASQQRTIELGTVTTGPDGHFQSTLTLPADYPLGYAELQAYANDGSLTSTWILVGPRNESTPAPPNQPGLFDDPAVILLSVLLAGGGLILVWTTIRASRREQALARPTQKAKAASRQSKRKPRS